MRALLSLFGRSPFSQLQSHMEKVADCVGCLPQIFQALEHKQFDKVEELSKKISHLEHQADLTKNDIRNNLPKSLFLPIERSSLLEILSIQDSLADAAEDAAILATLKQLQMPDSIKEDFDKFLKKNIEAFGVSKAIIKEMHDLLESSFGGVEAQKVQSMIEEVAFKEHEADLIQRKLLKHLYLAENEMSYSTFYLWQQIFVSIASLSNQAEKLANRVRMTLDIK